MTDPARPSMTEEWRQGPIRVIVADDGSLTRTAIINELARHLDMAVLGTAANSNDTLRLAETLQPDLLLLNITIPDLSAVDLIGQMRALPKPPQILAYEDSRSILMMLESTSIEHLLREDYPAAITAAVRAMARSNRCAGTTTTDRAVGQIMSETPQPIGVALSERELDVLRLLARGQTNREIAEALTISEGTVKNHVTRLYHKLNVCSRAEAVAWAWQHRVVGDA